MLKYLLTTQWFIFEGGRYFELEFKTYVPLVEEDFFLVYLLNNLVSDVHPEIWKLLLIGWVGREIQNMSVFAHDFFPLGSLYLYSVARSGTR